MMHDGVYEGVCCCAGQANYGYANAAMDMLALCRKDAGLPALAIQWGPIADVGFVAEIMKVGVVPHGALPQTGNRPTQVSKLGGSRGMIYRR